MSTWATGIQTQRALRLARVCWALAAVFALLALAVLLIIPEVSVLSQPDGTKYLFIHRQVDLPTGDPAVFWDYSLIPLCGALAVCYVFYVISAFYIIERHTAARTSGEPAASGNSGPAGQLTGP